MRLDLGSVRLDLGSVRLDALRIVVGMASFTSFLRARSDDDLVVLLTRRPDLASPSPSTLTSLAARATSRVSLDRALSAVDAAVLQGLEALVVAGRPEPATPEDVLTAVGAQSPADRTRLLEALDQAVVLALAWPDAGGLRPAPGLAEVLGPYPAGLAPDTGPAPRPEALADLSDVPPGARAVLDALTWGPPVGVRPSPGTPAAAAVDWLLHRGLLVPAENRHVLLPRAVALALRHGRTHRAPARPPVTGTARRDRATVTAESAQAAEAVVRAVAGLVQAWQEAPPPVLRSGGLAVRELRRVAGLLGTDEPTAALVVELAGAAGLVADDGEEEPAFVPTAEADTWTAGELPRRWAALARAWLVAPRVPWQVGERDERGAVRTALGPAVQRGWAPRLRRAVLDELAVLPAGSAPSLDDLLALARWRTPRAAPPAATVAGVLTEAGRLGLLGAGALAPAGRALLTGADIEAALVASLPDPVDDLLLQGDLTGVVPGRATPALDALLDRTATVESRGAALTVRFTEASVRSALDAGMDPEDLLAGLASHARGQLPQPLTYLVHDVARRHGRLRVGGAAAYLRSEDPTLLAGLAEDPRLARLGLVRLAPGVIASQAPPAELLAALRAHGLAPAAEGPGGQVLRAQPGARRRAGRPPRPARAAATPSPTDEEARVARATALVPELRRAEAARADAPTPAGGAEGAPGLPGGAAGHGPGGTGAGTVDPVEALALLRQAAEDRAEVWIEVVGPRGVPQRRLVRPLHVEGGRLRALDPAREAEITVTVHSIASATLASTTDRTTATR